MEGFNSSFTKFLAEYIAWFRNSRPDVFGSEVFNEINFLYLLGFRVSINKIEDLENFKLFIESAILMIDNGADATPYKIIILYKLRILVWNLIIKPIAEESCNKNVIILALYCLSLGQCRGISDDKIINLTVSQVLRYLKKKYNYYSLSLSQIDDYQEVQEINYYLGNIRVKPKSFSLEIQRIKEKYGFMNFQIEVEENKNLVNPNPRMIKSRLRSLGHIHNIKKKPPFYELRVKKYEFTDEENQKLIICAKVYKIYDSIQKDQIKNKINKEIEYYQKLSERASDENCFLKYYWTINLEKKIYLCMEYHQKSLEKKIESLAQNNSKLNDNLLELLVHHMIKSFELLDGLNLYHRDIKPQNFLFTTDDRLKIIDFGESETKDKDESTTNFSLQKDVKDMKVVGTKSYMAPELRKGYDNKQESVKGSRAIADVYSLGMTILRMATCKEILNLNLEESQSQLEEFINTNVSQDWLKDLLKKMLTYDFTKRPRFRECLNEIQKSETTN